jgi:hypothetical protein
MNQEEKEYFQQTTAFEFLNNVNVDGETFTTEVVMSFLALKFGEDAFSIGGLKAEEKAKHL